MRSSLVSLVAAGALLIAASTAMADETVTLKIVDQVGVEIAGSEIRVDGGTIVPTGGSILLTETSHSFSLRPGLLGSASEPLLERTESETVTAGMAVLEFEWKTATSTVNIVDQFGVAISDSLFRYLSIEGYIAAGTPRTLPITDATLYPMMTGTQSDGYDVRLRPGLNGPTVVHNVLERDEILLLTADTTTDYEWITKDISVQILDQFAAEIPGSLYRLTAVTGYVASGTVFTLPITDDSVYPTIFGSQADGYDVRLRPGLNGPTVVHLILERDETPIELTADTSINHTWITADISVQILDQFGVEIPDSLYRLTAVTGYVASGTVFTLPITDDSVYPTIFGSQADGYDVRLRPGLNGPTVVHLILERDETPIELTASGAPTDFEWITAEVSVRIVDQSDAEIPVSLYRFTAVTGYVASGTAFVLPITDDSVYPTIFGSQADGYDVRLRPGIGGFNIVHNLLERDEVLKLVADVDQDYEWKQLACTVELRDDSNVAVAGSTMEFPVGPAVGNGSAVVLPVNDPAVYPTAFGLWLSNYATTITPGDIASTSDTVALTAQVTGLFAPASFVIDGNTYKLACNEPPIAVAGADQSVHASDTVFLDGSGSFDDQSTGALEYDWEFVSRPPLSNATLTGADTAAPSFVADLPGTYVVRLVVTDEPGAESAPDDVTISSTNIAPTADAGDTIVAPIGGLVVFDGSGSSDPEMDALTYSWTLLSAPVGSNAVLLAGTTATPSLTPDLEESYIVELIVNDGFEDSVPHTVELVAVTPTEFVQYKLNEACDFIKLLPDESFVAKGHRNSMCNSYAQVIKFIQKGQISQAIAHLTVDITRVDGCRLRGSPDPMGEGQPDAADYLVICEEQEQVYDCLVAALAAIN